ncbi:phage integrase N-terminal domain-containing protein [Variovorax gossypii]
MSNPIHADRLAAFKASARELVLRHGKHRLNGNYASDRTVELTIETVSAACERLWRLNFEVRDIANLEERHVRALIRDWHGSGLKPKTIQNNVSRLRQICRWIGKPNLIPRRDGAAHFLPELDPKSFRVSTITERSKSWSENGIDVTAKIIEADGIDIRFGAMLRLGVAFGLRKKEQLRIVPTKADAVGCLQLRDNVAKSGKNRDILIEHPFQRAMLEHAKRVAGKGRYLGWPGRTFAQNEAKYAYHLRKIGITGRDADVVGHGLRAEYAENSALMLGLLPPTLGGRADQMEEGVRKAIQLKVSEAMGHHRIDVTGAYYGSFRPRAIVPRSDEGDMAYNGFQARTHVDMKANCLHGVIVGEGENIEFTGANTDELRVEFHRLVDKILADIADQNQRGGGGSTTAADAG